MDGLSGGAIQDEFPREASLRVAAGREGVQDLAEVWFLKSGSFRRAEVWSSQSEVWFPKTGVLLELIFKDDATGRRDIIVFWVLLLFTGFQFLSNVTKA